MEGDNSNAATTITVTVSLFNILESPFLLDIAWIDDTDKNSTAHG
jgi:hypothetical protein